MLAHATRSQARSRMTRLIILALAFSAIPLLPGSPVEPAAAVTGTTTRVSVSSAGAEANASSNYAEISADGQFVAFVSAATNLVTRIGLRYSPPLGPRITVETARAVPLCGNLGSTYICAGRDPFEDFAPPAVFAITFDARRISVWGTRYPSLEVWRYDGSSSRRLVHHTAELGPSGLFSYGLLGSAENK